MRLTATPFDEQVARLALDGIIGNAALGRVWLIAMEATRVGYVVLTFGYSLEFHGRDAFIDELYIEASHRGRGVGAEAMRLVEQECEGLSVKALHLEVERENKAGQSLYRRLGFKDHDRYLMTKWLR